MKTPSTRRLFLLAGTTMPWATFPGRAWAESGPTKPVRIVVPFSQGGTTDALARVLAPELQKLFGQPVTVDNKPGAGGNLAAAEVAKAAPDGSTLLMGTVGTHAINSSLYPTLPYDPIKDFAPIAMVAQVPNVLVMNPARAAGLGIKSVTDLIQVAKAAPGSLRFGSSGSGTSVHLSAELFKSMTDTQITHVVFKGSAQALKDVVAGRVDMMFDNLPSALPYIKSGELKAFAITSITRSMALLSVPTLEESASQSLAGYEATSWFGLLAPSATPLGLLGRIQSDITTILRGPSMRSQLLALGAIPGSMGQVAFSRFIASETRKWGKVVKASGAKAD